MKRDLTASCTRCRQNRIWRSTICSIAGTVLILMSLNWMEGPAGLRETPTLRLGTVGSERDSSRTPMIEIEFAPELFGSKARFGWSLDGQGQTPAPKAQTKPVRLVAMDRDRPSRLRARKS
jgi:hypothetical protein